MPTQKKIPVKTIDFFTKKLADEEKQLSDKNAHLPNIEALIGKTDIGDDFKAPATNIRDDLEAPAFLGTPKVLQLHSALLASKNYIRQNERWMKEGDQHKKGVKIVIAHLETLSGYILQQLDNEHADLETPEDFENLQKAFFLRLDEELFPLSEDMRVVVSVAVGAILGLASMAVFGVVPEALDFLSEIASFTGIPEFAVAALTGIVNTAVGAAIGAGAGFFARHLNHPREESQVQKESAGMLNAIEQLRPASADYVR